MALHNSPAALHSNPSSHPVGLRMSQLLVSSSPAQRARCRPGCRQCASSAASDPQQQHQQQQQSQQRQQQHRQQQQVLQQSVPAPWSLTFDLRERETDWTEENKARLVAMIAAQQLSIPMQEMEGRLEALMVMLPDLAGRIQRLQPSLLASLTSDLQLTSSRLLGLRELLPAANVSAIVASRPQLLLQETAEVKEAVEALQGLLHLEQVDRLVEVQPLFLVTECVQQVLGEMQRLMPGSNAAALLVSDPGWLLRLQRGQQWLGLHPDSQLGEQVDWQPPKSSGSSGS